MDNSKHAIKILDPTEDAELLNEAWQWQQNAPRWFRESQSIAKETLRDFLDKAKNELLFGIFDDSRLTAVVRLVPANNLCEVHLFAKRHTDPLLLFDACRSIKSYLFDKGIKNLAGWIPRKNYAVVKLYKALGFVGSSALSMNQH